MRETRGSPLRSTRQIPTTVSLRMQQDQYKVPACVSSLEPPFGYEDSQTSIFAEISDSIVPVGSAAYDSTITNHTETLPVCQGRYS
ncbi:hypothetical protein BDR22DRAFT_854756 [Usnea florida]